MKTPATKSLYEAASLATSLAAERVQKVLELHDCTTWPGTCTECGSLGANTACGTVRLLTGGEA